MRTLLMRTIRSVFRQERRFRLVWVPAIGPGQSFVRMAPVAIKMARCDRFESISLSVVRPRRLPGRAGVLSAVDEKAVDQLYREQCVNLTGVISALHKVTVNDCLNSAAIPVWSGKRAFIKQHLTYIL
jgi:hypothetical protein